MIDKDKIKLMEQELKCPSEEQLAYEEELDTIEDNALEVFRVDVLAEDTMSIAVNSSIAGINKIDQDLFIAELRKTSFFKTVGKAFEIYVRTLEDLREEVNE